MDINSFVVDNDIECTNNVVDEMFIDSIENTIGVKIGSQLHDYIIKYGYLAYKFIELYGVNSVQLLKSDMVSETIYLHEYYLKTKEYIAIENLGDGKYVLVNTSDEVFTYDTDVDELTDSGKLLFDYIITRFQEIMDC